MPHSQHDRAPSSKENRRRSTSRVSKGKSEKPNHVPDNANEGTQTTGIIAPIATPPAEQQRPWSQWIPGDDGRWFYQGRLKADGSGWEYQFTGGYPPAPRPRDPSLAMHYTEAVLDIPYQAPAVAVADFYAPEIQQPQLELAGRNTEFGGNGEGHPEGITINVPSPPGHPRIVAAEQSQAVTLAANARPLVATKQGDGSGRQAIAKQARGGKASKTLSATGKADKERRVSSRKRIKSWLSEVTP